MRHWLPSATAILCSIALLTGCGETKEIVVPVIKIEKVEIDPALLQRCWRPRPPEHAEQRRRAALSLELLNLALDACDKQIDQIRQQQERGLAAGAAGAQVMAGGRR